MKLTLSILVAAFGLALTANPCFALWDVEIVTKERAKELGVEVRAPAAGPNAVAVEFEFKAEGQLKNFSRVDLRFGNGNNPAVAATLRADRSKPGRVAVSFTADPAQLDKVTLWVMVPETLGGSIYEVRVKDFVEGKTGR